tara:strand:- start:77 stop:694 length:618 start_codon:yes stop_codon:yes gene_type:complete
MKRKSIITPVGTAVWPKLNEPDTRYSTEGQFSVTLRLGGEDAVALMKDIDAFYAVGYEWHCQDQGKNTIKKCSSMPYEAVESDTGEKTGEVNFKFKLKHRVETRRGDTFIQTVALFDGEGTPMKEVVGGGSLIRVRGQMNPWFTASLGFGISLWVNAVQVKELAEASGGTTAESFGFSALEGGYATPDEMVQPNPLTEASSDGDF